MAGTQLNTILEKFQSKDKDFRYMATSDLQNELSKDTFRSDDLTEKRLCTLILQQLEDISGDISALAVKCLGLLTRKVGQARVEFLVESLSDKLVTGKKEQDRDIASIGLKTVVAEASGGQLAQVLVKKVTPKMVEGLKSTEYGVVNASLDILIDLTSKAGGLMGSDHTKLRDCLLPVLDDNRAGLRKRAIHCIAALAPFLNDQLLDSINETVLSKLHGEGLSHEAAHTYIQALGSLSRATGWRFGKQLDQAVPIAIQYSKSISDGDYELQEYSLQALEAFVSRSPHEAQAHVQPIFEAALKGLSFDPNYADDMDADEEDGSDEEVDEDMSDEGYSDDEDTSWKVRRAAAKMLAAIIDEYPSLLGDIYPQASQHLVARFREREENIKADVFNTFVQLIHQVGAESKRLGSSPAITPPTALLRADVPTILRATARQLKDKSPKTKAGAIQVLKALVDVLPEAIAADIDQLVPGILAALNEKNSSASNLKIQALQFFGQALGASSSQAWQPHLSKLAGPTFASAGDRYYKISAEAIRVSEALVYVIRPAPPAPVAPSVQALVPALFTCVTQRLGAQDQDQEVKDAAISCTATAVAMLGDLLGSDYAAQIKVLLDRLKNEITRLTTVKAFTRIAESPLHLSFGHHMQPLLAELISFLRKANRPLRQASLSAIDALLQHKEAGQIGSLAADVTQAVGVLITDKDLVLTALSLRVACTLLRCHPASAPSVSSQLLPPAITLSQSPLLQGTALEALQAFFIALLQSGTQAASFELLLNSLLSAGDSSDTGKSAQVSIAQCIAVLCAAAGPHKTAATVERLLAILQSSRAGAASAKHLALLSVGEIGRSTDLSSFPSLQPTLTVALTSPSEELKNAASQALGAVCVGNLPGYLPFVLQQIQDQAANPKDQYLLLKALNEVIVSLAASSSGQLAPAYRKEVLTLLLNNCESEEECRNVVAECLGHLALLAPEQVLPCLQQQTSAESSSMRTAVVTAVKYTLVDQPHPVDSHLQAQLPAFLALLADPDRHVRKAAIQLLSIAAHNKVGLVRDQLPGLLPQLYAQTVIDESLIRTVDLGPFKHRIDDGLELRKAAFECLDVLLDAARDRLNLPAFIRHLQSGLKDHYDVKMPCHLLLSKLASMAGGHVLDSLDKLVEPLQMTLSTKLKSDAVKQEVDRNEDMLRSCLRAIESCAHIPNVETCTAFRLFMENTVHQPSLSAKYLAVKKEREEAEGLDVSSSV